MRVEFVSLAILFLSVSALATADTSSSLLKNTSIKIEDLDDEVNDIKFRTASGAKSKFSSSLSLYYLGGSLEKPGGDLRPNVGKTLNPQPVSASGDLGLRYRLNKNESLYLAAGFYRQRPVHGREGEQLELNSPMLGYNDTFALDEIELSSGFRLYISTTGYERAIGQVAMFGYSASTMNNLGTSRFSAGVSMRAYYTAFDKNDDSARVYQSDYGFGLSPSLQYNKSGRLNAYTSLNVFNYEHARIKSDLKFDKRPITQSFGIGIAVARDFYLSPYLAFEPENIRSANTSVNLTAMLNL